jgi:DNA-binding MarR family transcriptional regulator
LPQTQFGLRSASLPDRLLKLPPPIFNPNRIRIMLTLYNVVGADFTELKEKLDLSDGALATYLKALVKDQLVTTEQDRTGTRERTVYMITRKGLQTIDEMLEVFGSIKEEISQ